MKLVKCIFNSGGTYLTINKIYQVTNNFSLDGQTYIEIKTDKGVDMIYNIDSITTIFIDIQQVRDNKLNELGI